MLELARARYRHRQALLLYRAGQVKEAEGAASRAVDLLRQRYLVRPWADPRELSVSLVVQAQFLTELLRLEDAERAYSEALGLPCASAGPRSLYPADVLMDRADVRRRRADYESASSDLEAAELHIQSLGSPRGLLARWNNTSGIVAKETGRFADAASYYALAMQLCGDDDELKACVLHNLAGLAYMRQSFAEAEGPARAALQLHERLHGAQSAGVAADACVLGAVLAELSHHDEAEELLERALTIWHDRFGDDHYEVAATLHVLATLHLKRTQLDVALPEFEEALRIKTLVLGRSHPEIAVVLNNLGILHSKAGRQAEAREHHEMALSLLTQAYGPRHPYTMRVAAHATQTDP